MRDVCPFCETEAVQMVTIHPFLKPNGITLDARAPAMMCVRCYHTLMDAGFRALEDANKAVVA